MTSMRQPSPASPSDLVSNMLANPSRFRRPWTFLTMVLVVPFCSTTPHSGRAVAQQPSPTPLSARPAAAASTQAAGLPRDLAYDPKLIKKLIADARAQGDSQRGADVFVSPQFACLSCHRIGSQGGAVGPDLTNVAR